MEHAQALLHLTFKDPMKSDEMCFVLFLSMSVTKTHF